MEHWIQESNNKKSEDNEDHMEGSENQNKKKQTTNYQVKEEMNKHN